MPDIGLTDTVLGRWLRTENDGQLSRGAVVATGADIGLEAVPVRQVAGTPTLGGDQFGVIAAAGARSKFGKAMDKVGKAALLVARGDSTGEEAVDVVCPACDGDPAAHVTPADEFFLPAGSFVPGWQTDKTIDKTASFAGRRAFKLDSPTPDLERVLLFTGGRPPEAVFGGTADDLGAEPVPAGETFEAKTTVIAGPVDTMLGEADASVGVRRAFNEGVPAPTSGASFGMGVLSTPNAEVAGESASPLVERPTAEVLTDERVRDLLERTGLTDASEVRWLTGPEPVEVDDEATVTIFGGEPDPPGLQSFTGTVEGEVAPWRVGVHVVRATDEDHVVVAGSHRWPVGSEEGGTTILSVPSPPTMVRARELLVEAVARLEQR